MHYRIYPNDRKRVVFSVRGVVEESGIRESGWWIFKETFPFVHVRISGKQRSRLASYPSSRSDLGGIPRIFNVKFLTPEELNDYPVGTEVGLTYSTADKIEQYFTGAVPLRLETIQPLAEGVVLENEI